MVMRSGLTHYQSRARWFVFRHYVEQRGRRGDLCTTIGPPLDSLTLQLQWLC